MNEPPRLLWEYTLASGGNITAVLFHDRTLGDARLELLVRAAYDEAGLATKLAADLRNALQSGSALAFEEGARRMKMRYRVGAQGWPVGEFLIPAGATMDTTGSPFKFDRWSREVWNRKLFPPPDAIPLDEAARSAMAATSFGHFVPILKTQAATEN
jgi:hypothetical protein